ncbi:MAG: S4 domain-containing protein, partial [Chlamydiales bacterium]
LNKERLSPYDFYQYLFRMPDVDVAKLLKRLTFLELEEIEEIISRVDEPNFAQKRLAQEVTRLIHGEEGLVEAEKITQAARPGAQTELKRDVLQSIPNKVLPKEIVLGKKAVDLLVEAEIVGSKSEARRLISHGGVYLNNEKVEDEHLILSPNHLVEGKFLLFGVGKKKKIVISIE